MINYEAARDCPQTRIKLRRDRPLAAVETDHLGIITEVNKW